MGVFFLKGRENISSSPVLRYSPHSLHRFSKIINSSSKITTARSFSALRYLSFFLESSLFSHTGFLIVSRLFFSWEPFAIVPSVSHFSENPILFWTVFAFNNSNPGLICSPGLLSQFFWTPEYIFYCLSFPFPQYQEFQDKVIIFAKSPCQ